MALTVKTLVLSENQKESVCEAKVDKLKEYMKKAILTQKDNWVFLNIEEPESGYETVEAIEQNIISFIIKK